ncbi:hypothetical protein DL98DRAFT_656054 [Cadophora sp. DSE1049]|nr:hypothetical protein DL98DRAFT_656054 [Cadophora sp. DSE1049]
MHTHIALLASLGLLAPALAAPLSANIEISVSDDSSLSVPGSSLVSNNHNAFEYCHMESFPPGFPCDQAFGDDWHYSNERHACCRGIPEDEESISHFRHSPIVSPSEVTVQHSSNVFEFCRPNFFPPQFPCKDAFGPEWYYSRERESCCKEIPEDEASFPGLNGSPHSSLIVSPSELTVHHSRNAVEFCQQRFFPPDFPCSEVFGEQWYYSKKSNTCCRQFKEEDESISRLNDSPRTSHQAPMSTLKAHHSHSSPRQRCIKAFFPPDYPCAENLGEGWYYSPEVRACCQDLPENIASISHHRDASVQVPVSSLEIHSSHNNWERCIPDSLPEGFPCARHFGEGWYYSDNRHTCCQRIGEEDALMQETLSTPSSSRASVEPSSSSVNDNIDNAFELCLRALFPPDFPCSERFGEEWYYSDKARSCCKKVSEEKLQLENEERNQVLMSTASVSSAGGKAWERCVPGRFPPGFTCADHFGEGWDYSEDKYTCCQKIGEGEEAFGMPTGFGSHVDAKVAGYGGMPTGFEEQPKAESQVNFHSEML